MKIQRRAATPTLLAFVVLLSSSALMLTASGYEVVGQISGNQQLAPDFGAMRVVLNDGLYSSFVTSTGHFKIQDVPKGAFCLEFCRAVPTVAPTTK